MSFDIEVSPRHVASAVVAVSVVPTQVLNLIAIEHRRLVYTSNSLAKVTVLLLISFFVFQLFCDISSVEELHDYQQLLRYHL